ncbi:MAG: chorismate mutase [Candidatus Planktophila sp.]|jgi:chorismate mutase|nr:chorismate mutase [Candidatus Planktophila sp.]
MRVRAVRGATQVSANTPAAIFAGVQELIGSIMSANSLTPDMVISVHFTSTPDLTAAFPAAAARAVGFEAVPLIGSVEVDVPGALERAIRVMLTCETDAPAMSHIYLHGAQSLRKDIAQ